MIICEYHFIVATTSKRRLVHFPAAKTYVISESPFIHEAVTSSCDLRVILCRLVPCTHAPPPELVALAFYVRVPPAPASCFLTLPLRLRPRQEANAAHPTQVSILTKNFAAIVVFRFSCCTRWHWTVYPQVAFLSQSTHFLPQRHATISDNAFLRAFFFWCTVPKSLFFNLSEFLRQHLHVETARLAQTRLNDFYSRACAKNANFYYLRTIRNIQNKMQASTGDRFWESALCVQRRWNEKRRGTV